MPNSKINCEADCYGLSTSFWVQKGQIVRDWKWSRVEKFRKSLPYHHLTSRESNFNGFTWRAGHLQPLIGRHREPREDEVRKARPTALPVKQRRNAALGRNCTFRLLVCKSKPWWGFLKDLLYFFWSFIYFLKLINLFLFSYNCLHFLPFPPPHPSQSHLPPQPLPSPLILSLCPL